MTKISEKNPFVKFAVWMVCIIALICMCFHLTSCDDRHHKSVNDVVKDSTWVAEQFQNALNPKFKTLDGIMKYREKLSTECYDDSVFTTIPQPTLINVATVILNRDGIVSKEAIVDEYTKSQNVYDNLPKTPIDQYAKVRADSTEYSFKDTTINGKKAHIKTIIDYAE